jgi:ribosomal protein L40E
MIAGVLHIFAFLIIVAITLLVFVAWVIGMVVRTFVGAIRSIFGHSRPPQISQRQCSRLRCGAPNPLQANYCRRCGTQLVRVSVSPRRGVWRVFDVMDQRPI